MDRDIEALSARLERVERSNRVLRAVLIAVGLVGVGCGATTTVANYGTVRAHTLEVFAAGETGDVLTLGRDARGGRVELKSAAGEVALVIDVDGVHPAGAK